MIARHVSTSEWLQWQGLRAENVRLQQQVNDLQAEVKRLERNRKRRLSRHPEARTEEAM